MTKLATSLLKSAATTVRANTRPTASWTSTFSCPNTIRLQSKLLCLQSLLPHYSAVSSARLTSCLGIDSKGSRSLSQGKLQQYQNLSAGTNEVLKMVLVVRQDLKMGTGKIASQCAHAAIGIYSELMRSHRSLIRQWEIRGQAKIVVTCKNQQEMNKLKEAAESIGLPTFVVADAGRTQVLSGSKTVLAIGPGSKASLDSVTGKLRLL